MSRTRKRLDDAIVAELRARPASLRAKSYEDLGLLPESNTEQTTVAGKPVSFTVFREWYGERKLLVLIRSDKPIFFGIGPAGTTEGFWALPSGEKREAFGDEISEFFA
jgi:hypothetical protein